MTKKQFTDGNKVLELLNQAETLICCMFADGQQIAVDSLISNKAQNIHNYLQTRGYDILK